MTRVSGYSDDLVYIECNGVEDEIPCNANEILQIEFEDETVIGVHYGTSCLDIWTINVLIRGTAAATLNMCGAHDDETYSDSFEIDSKVKQIVRGRV